MSVPEWSETNFIKLGASEVWTNKGRRQLLQLTLWLRVLVKQTCIGEVIVWRQATALGEGTSFNDI